MTGSLDVSPAAARALAAGEEAELWERVVAARVRLNLVAVRGGFAAFVTGLGRKGQAFDESDPYRAAIAALRRIPAEQAS